MSSALKHAILGNQHWLEERSPREEAKNMPYRLIKVATLVDYSRYKGEDLRKIRAERGLSNRWKRI